MKIFVELLKNVKDYKKFAWPFIIVILILIMIYPIIDANFLYYQRVSNRVEILNKVSNIDVDSLKDDDQLLEEYYSILDEISEKENNYLNNIFIYEESLKNNVIKIVSASWLFVLVGILVPFAKENKKKSKLFNLACVGFCLIISGLFGYIGYIIPTIINVFVNVLLYTIILIYLAYTISKSTI